MTKLRQVLFSISFALLTLILALSLSWLVLGQMNFLYGLFHDRAGIGAGIDHYGPKNRYKPGFGETSREQRIQLFAEINRAVHNGGEGLNDIFYQTRSSEGRQRLLREPEVVHLQDVADLIDLLKVVVLASLVAWFALVVMARYMPSCKVSWRRQLVGLAGVIAVSSITLMIFGPKNVFNQLHIWIFPKEHQWFFYYQDSLMSTLMLAPQLFGWIAIAMAALAVIFFFSLSLLAAAVLQRTQLKKTP